MAAPAPIPPVDPGGYTLFTVNLYLANWFSLYGDGHVFNFIEVRFQGPNPAQASSAQGRVKADSDPDTGARLVGVMNAMEIAMDKHGFNLPMPTFAALIFNNPPGPPGPPVFTINSRYQWFNT